MNIILTRPLNDTENLMQELFSLGHKIMHIPTLKIKNANLEKINIEDYNALVFTSSNAVRNLNVNGKKENIKCFCVGSVTEKVARLSGFTKTLYYMNGLIIPRDASQQIQIGQIVDSRQKCFIIKQTAQDLHHLM